MQGEKIFLVVNPVSGRAKMKSALLTVVQILSNAGNVVTVYPTKSRGDARKALSRLSNDYTTVVCCGGDGTLNEVVTGVIESKNNYKIGYIPSGTLNEWSSGLKISRNISKAAKDIVEGRVIPLDIGSFGSRYFCYTASFGAFTEASYSAPQDVKNVMGQAAYLFEGIKSLGNIKPISLEITCKEKTVKGEFLFGAVSNSLSLGGVLKLDETRVQLNDGLFEVLLIRNPKNLAQLQNIIDSLIRRDLNREGIEFFHTNEIKVKSEAPLSWTLDGEFAKSEDEAVIKNMSHRINFIVPQK